MRERSDSIEAVGTARTAQASRCPGALCALGRLSLVVMDPALLNWREVDEILVHKLRFWGHVFFPKPGD